MKGQKANSTDNGSLIFDNVIIGFPSQNKLDNKDCSEAKIGKNPLIRSGTVIYCDVEIGDCFKTGHNVLVRENTSIGNNVSIGSSSVIEGSCTIGDNTNIQSMVFIPTGTKIESSVFIGPNTVFTNDLYPPGKKDELDAPYIKEGASIGANSTILPGITIGRGSLVAAGAIVTKDVPDKMMAVGCPARIRNLPELYSGRTK